MGRKSPEGDFQKIAISGGLLRPPSVPGMPFFSGGTLLLVSPSDNAWRSKNYNMLIKDQRLLSDMASLSEEGSEWDTSIALSPSAFRAATTAGLLDNTTLAKLGLGHLIKSSSSGETIKSAYSSSLLIDTRSILSGEESSSSFGGRLSTSDRGSDVDIEGFVIPPTKLAKALRLLNDPPITTEFENEEEMLQVYQLIYDALRYRIVFDQTLAALSFFDEYPKLRSQERVVHILFFDLQQRHFLSRDNYTLSETEKDKELSGLLFGPGEEKNQDFINTVRKVEALLWEMRIHLAAAVARLRIRRHAFYLIHLLPEHLRGPSHLDGSAKRALSFWINNFLIRKGTVDLIFQDSGIQLVEEEFTLPRSSSIEDLEEMSYFYDTACMNLIFCHPYLRDAIIHSQLVKENCLVIQDRSFCLGPALLCRRLNEWGISGSVVQTHIGSVRVTAYLASLLNEYKSELAVKPEMVLAFGAGERKNEYEASLKAMGITNVIVYSEPWIKIASTVIQTLVNASANYETTYPNIAISPDFTYSCIPIPIDMEEVFEQLDNVVAVYATPPNTYSAVPDPVELAVSRGGDMKLLEEFTRHMVAKYEIAYEDILRSHESKEDQEYLLKMMDQEREKEEVEEKEKLLKLNKEQWEVLSLCLSLPQTQVVVYETHSTKTSENKELVESAMSAANSAATVNFKKYIEERETMQKKDEEHDEQNEAPKDTMEQRHQDDTPHVENKPLNFENGVPLTDLFEVEDIPGIKETSKEDGCSISLIKRKEFVLLNNRYLIQMAEARGLFEKKVEDKNKSPSDSAKATKQKRKGRTFSEESDNSADYIFRPGNRNKEMEIERIAAPTVASLRRSRRWSSKRSFKTSKSGENDSTSEDDFEKYVCSRCANRGEDDCQHALKMEVVDGRWWSKGLTKAKKIIQPYACGGRLVHPSKCPKEQLYKRKLVDHKVLDVTSKEKLLKRLVIPTEVSLLHRNITWEEHKAKIQDRTYSCDLGEFTRESLFGEKYFGQPIETQERKVGTITEMFNQKDEKLNSSSEHKCKVIDRPISSFSRWRTEPEFSTKIKENTRRNTANIVEKSVQPLSTVICSSHPSKSKLIRRDCLRHNTTNIKKSTTSSLNLESEVNDSSQLGKLSLASCITTVRNDVGEIQNFFQVDDREKNTVLPLDILSLDEEEGLMLKTAEKEKFNSTEEERIIKLKETSLLFYKHHTTNNNDQTLNCDSKVSIKSKNEVCSSKNDQVKRSGNDEIQRQMSTETDGKQILYPLKSKLIKFHYPDPKSKK